MAKSTKPAVICSHPKLAQGGFSLIEVAITLIVLGLIIVPMIHTYKMWRLEQTRTMDFGN
nr:prepilin-type N-terminal cleavage/methylation domain-containing protein [Alphaproteobacteria bacterium]